MQEVRASECYQGYICAGAYPKNDWMYRGNTRSHCWKPIARSPTVRKLSINSSVLYYAVCT